jgi:OOP family OmpA-OmpF porin
MYKPLLVAAGAALLLSACERPQAVVAAASPQTAQPARNFMLFFGNDQATLTPDGDVVVHEAVGAAKGSPNNTRITVAGHADTSGNSAYNQALSQRRAAAVKEALIRQGINEAAISVVGRGEQELLVSTQDGVREPKNRRVEIIVQ